MRPRALSDLSLSRSALNSNLSSEPVPPSSHNDDSNLNSLSRVQDSSKKPVEQECIICMSGRTRQRDLIPLPCKNCSKSNLVHRKCIFEWREQLESRGSCPLCRGRLSKIEFTPIDYLNSRKLLMCSAEISRLFCTTPVVKQAGMVKGFLKVKNNPWWGSPFLYEFYIQEVGIKKYPFGPLPSNKSPKSGDIFLMSAKKRSSTEFTSSSLLHSVVDISLEKTFMDSQIIGRCESNSFLGLEYIVSMPIFSRCAEVKAGGGTQTPNLSGLRQFFSTKRNSKVDENADFSGQEYVEIAAVQYSQNRIGADSGPRKMRVALPNVCEIEKEKCSSILLGSKVWPSFDNPSVDRDVKDNSKIESRTNHSPGGLLSDIDFGRDDGEGDVDCDDEGVFLSDNKKPSPCQMHCLLEVGALRKSLRSKDVAAAREKVTFGSNKKPSWLSRIQAYSLDFNGRVTLPSNKNFQLELEGSGQDIFLQFGKVQSASECVENVSVYTVDFKFPLSPLQAFAIAISSCDRKLACA